MRRHVPHVVFVHGISGPPSSGWADDLRLALTRLDPDADEIKMSTLRYDDVFDDDEPESVDHQIQHPRRPVPPRLRRQRRESLVQIADSLDPPEGPRIVPPPVVGEILLRSPVGGMDHARAYRHDDAVAERVRARVAHAVGSVPGPRIVIGHSMGSIVALEALHEHGVNVDLMVTLGSPLGVDPAWRRRWLTPQQFRWTRVGAWANVVNMRDPVSWGQGVSSFYPNAVDVYIKAGRLPFGSGGAHDPSTYLKTSPVPELLRTGWATASVSHGQ